MVATLKSWSLWQTRSGSVRSGRVSHWVKVKDPAAAAVTREAEEDWAADLWLSPLPAASFQAYGVRRTRGRPPVPSPALTLAAVGSLKPRGNGGNGHDNPHH